MSRVAAVVIGRNEGARLERCLTSLQGQVDQIVYVDSGSTDSSVAFARSLGVSVVELDTSVPFTAARARNEGFAAVKDADYVQFVDGDCGVVEFWIEKAAEALDNAPRIGIVTGWRSEIAPDATVYNAMVEVEWHRPAGDIAACGGDMMVRADVFRELGGFNPRVIASEDDEIIAPICTSSCAWYRCGAKTRIAGGSGWAPQSPRACCRVAARSRYPACASAKASGATSGSMNPPTSLPTWTNDSAAPPDELRSGGSSTRSQDH